MFSAIGERLFMGAVSIILLASAQYDGRGQASAGSGPPPTSFQPYTAEFRITRVISLANGTTLTRESKRIEAMDSDRQKLTVTSETSDSDATANTITSVIHADGTVWVWKSRNREAAQIAPPPEQRHGCWENDTGLHVDYGVAVYTPQPMPQKPRQETVRVEETDLGADSVDGIEVRGRRFTRTIPAGTVGNDQPLVAVSEFWQAPSLRGLTLRSVKDDPQNGKTTRELTNLNLNDPDPAIFRPPSNYRIINQEMHQVPCDQLPH